MRAQQLALVKYRWECLTEYSGAPRGLKENFVENTCNSQRVKEISLRKEKERKIESVQICTLSIQNSNRCWKNDLEDYYSLPFEERRDLDKSPLIYEPFFFINSKDLEKH